MRKTTKYARKSANGFGLAEAKIFAAVKRDIAQVSLDPSTQAEHREVAQQVLTLLRAAAPEVIGAFFPE